jgi:uncharacterized SAM-binding protein YcdF (DUF218 family)
VFFYLAKTFWFFVQPLNLAIFLLLAGMVAALLRWRRLAGIGSVFGILVLVVSSWTSFGAMILNPLEERFQRPTRLPEKIDGIIVLGGGMEGAINLARGGYELNNGGDRFVEAAVLARRFPDARILLSGGVGTVLLEGEPDADMAARFLAALGIPRERMILENRSRNTAENAEFSKELVDPQTAEAWLLVTSGFHMPRSVGLFRKAGFRVIPWATDYRTSGTEGIGLFRDNPLDALENTSTAVREWIGLAAYWVSGRTDTLFPGPD